MKAIARLILTTFFTLESLAIVGSTVVVGLLVGALICLHDASVLSSVFSLQMLGLTALGGIFMTSMYVPSTYSRLAQSRSIDLLPGGRLKLLVSSLLSIVIVSLPIPIAIIGVMKTTGSYGLENVSYYGQGVTALDYVQAPFFWYVFAIAVLGYTWIYVVIWSAAGIREHALGAITRTLVLMFLPVPFVLGYQSVLAQVSSLTLAILIAVLWGLLAFMFLVVARLRAVSETRLKFRMLIQQIRLFTFDTAGSELRLVLGLRHSIFYATGITVVSLMLLLSTKVINGWVLYLTIFGMVTGGGSANVAARSRRLWLRRDWSRTKLFKQVEILLWRSVGFRVAVLAIWVVLVGQHASFSRLFVAYGLLHLAVTTIASVYLGLIQAGGRRWTDGAVIVFIFAVAITGAAVSAGALNRLPIFTAILAGFTFANRFVAKQRWTQLDWTLCRPLRTIS